jgi:hypothetical protein
MLDDATDLEVSRRNVLKTISAGSVGALGTSFVSGSAAANAVFRGGSSSQDRITGGTGYCSTNNPWYQRATFSKGQIGYCVDLLDMRPSPYGSGDIYYFNAATTASHSYYEQRSVFEKQEWTAEEFCSNAPGEGGYANMETSINVENQGSAAGLQIPDGSLGVGGSPSQLLSSETEERQADMLRSVFAATIGTVPMLGSVVSAGEVVNSFGSSNKDVGGNQQTFTWEFDNWIGVPDDFKCRSTNTLVQFAIRTNPDTTPRFTVQNRAHEPNKDSLDAGSTFEVSDGRLNKA